MQRKPCLYSSNRERTLQILQTPQHCMPGNSLNEYMEKSEMLIDRVFQNMPLTASAKEEIEKRSNPKSPSLLDK